MNRYNDYRHLANFRSEGKAKLNTAIVIIFVFEGGGDNGYGSAIITSLKTFDREQRKEYLLPIIIRDSGTPPVSGTNTLTIAVGDFNDNRHYSGHKKILYYNYKGIFTCSAASF